ncbi:3-ketodihydrosphingosine reductase [Bacillus rossius redtenbacheri]|uniref:3-ketodihydrosphingosine reductase n=1 Tax=Bacillus rossius redtenbacheri TaxID=93214 RepID=UPI002FDDCFE8
MACLFMVAFLFVLLLLVLKKLLWRRGHKSLENLHVVVTGGSSGIGKSVAVEAARRGAHVTLVARDVERLEAAKVEVVRSCLHPERQKVQYVSLDVSDNYEAIERALLCAEDDVGPIYMLVNCAGTAVCGRLEDMTVADIKMLVSLNVLGTVYPTRAVVPLMKQRKSGCVVLVASEAAMLGVYGLGVYSGTKFAVRGLAEALHMEAKPYNVSVTLCLPPDTDTPGFAVEEQSKPIETKLISESGGLVAPEVVAKQMVSDALRGKFFSTVGSTGLMLRLVCAGMSPASSLAEAVMQVCFMGLLRIVSLGYLFYFKHIISKCMKNREKTKKLE